MLEVREKTKTNHILCKQPEDINSLILHTKQNLELIAFCKSLYKTETALEIIPAYL